MLKSLFQKISPALIVKEAQAPTRAVSEHEQQLAAICALPAADALPRLATTERGLGADDAAARRKAVGPNEIGVKKRSGAWGDLLRRFRNPLVVQLLVICGVALAMGDVRSAIVVGAMLFLSVVLAHFQESRSSRAVEKLRALVQTTVVVLRDGAETEVGFPELAPGDIVVLHAGSIIPADVRLISAKDFFVSQAALTGESMPVEKTAEPCAATGRGTIELPNACFQGSTVLSGAARAVVVLTGAHTYFGAISQRLAGQQVQTSFDRGIAGFTWLMIRFMMVMVSAVFLIVGLTKGNWLEALLFALAVAVGLTPEMLPMIVTVNLAKGALAMSRKQVIVKRLNAIQNFGAMDILCSDKTGTLTQDRVVLEKYVDVTNRPSEDVLRYAYMNSYYQTGLRNLLDRAILAHTDLDVERSCPKVDEIPFDFQRRRMSVVIDYEDAHVLICKGAVEELFKVCDRYQVDEEINPLIDVLQSDLLEEYEALSADGYRVLAIAYKEFTRERKVFSVADEKQMILLGYTDESQMILLGYIAFFDPPKDSSARALQRLHQRGVRVKVLTGDNALVTRKICRDVGLDAGTIVTGDQLAGFDRDQLADVAEQHAVFARLSPAQKDDLIQALQRRGHVVGFLGDGINDAPSLKTADVGISVDSAVDVAKESADIILLEKNLLVLEDGIIEGRRVFSNIIKYIRMGASSNFGNMFSVVGGSYFLPFLPMTSIQILVNNLLYDCSQAGIPSDRVDDEFLQQPRKWNIGNIKKFMLCIGPISSIFDYATFFLMLYFFNCRLFAQPATTLAAKIHCEQLFHTGWFVESLLTQTMIVHIIRTRKIPFFQSRPSFGMLGTTLTVMAIGAWLPYSPLAPFLGLVPLPVVYWFWMAGFLLAYAVLTHFVKVWFHNRYGVD
ncbi:MAG: magnesium-translocating P-type ATPase [Kiritimatiellaeota bacterium]|nr:magnesium-translocating P-type ATPase [Kiritimatiellota bacterium]